MSERILVTATKDGFYGAYRAAGSVFEVAEEAFSDFWMSRGPVVQTRDRTEEMALAARAESIAAGGAAAALTVALADLQDAKTREAALDARVAELEEAVAARDAKIAEFLDNGAEPAPAPDAPTDVPVQRVRRTGA